MVVAVVAPLVLTAGLLAGCGPPAHGTVTASNGGMIFTAASEKANDVTVTAVGGGVEISDAGDTITPGNGCTRVDDDTARCGGVTSMALLLKDGNDVASNNTNVPATLFPSAGPGGMSGGPGDDDLFGGSAADHLFGDAGFDWLYGNGGPDRFVGGDNQDVFVEGIGAAVIDALDADTFEGGSGGPDLISYLGAAARVRVDLDDVADDGRPATPVTPAEGDNVKADVEHVQSGGGNDSLVGDADANFLRGASGADDISGGAGNDTLWGQSGVDPLDGGEGTDACDVGEDGGITVNCES
jgi:Ca2+-binding RTX toxin-like protein